MTLRQPITVSIGRVRRMILPAQRIEPVPDSVFHEAGIDPALLDQPSARVTGDQYVAMVLRLIEYLGDEGLGFFSRRLARGTFAMIARNTLGVDTIRQAMRRASRACSAVQDDFVVELAEEGGVTGLRVRLTGPLAPEREFAFEILLVAVHRLLDWLRMGRLQAVRCDLAFEAPSHASDFRRVYGCEVLFAQPETILWFDSASLAAPMRRDAREMREYLADAARNVLSPFARHASYTERVRELLRKSRPDWAGLADAAASLNLSPSTLQRHLASESYTFQSCKDELRRDLAIALLNSTTRPLEAIAAELGFSDSATFQRAFKEWTGTAPGMYRKRLQV